MKSSSNNKSSSSRSKKTKLTTNSTTAAMGNQKDKLMQQHFNKDAKMDVRNNKMTNNSVNCNSNDNDNIINIRAPNGFICGVIEGFYGRPWTSDERRTLFDRLKDMGMNTYMYAPKDDIKHRSKWREMYTTEEAEHLQSLINAARSAGIDFYYALSPGLDLTFSSADELGIIKQKLDQVKNLGCESFALLFDDIDPRMNPADKAVFDSPAHAQTHVTNEIYVHLGRPRFMYCPTEYCESRAIPTLSTSPYLRHIGQNLSPEINIFWTGPRIVSRLILPEHIAQVTKVFRRPPLIWDNLHANDYDPRRFYIGPYAGRPCCIRSNLAGVLTNPNCEFEANFIPMHTLSQWSRCTDDALGTDDDEDNSNDQIKDVFLLAVSSASSSTSGFSGQAYPIDSNIYHPKAALAKAIRAWLPHTQTCAPAFAPLEPLEDRKGIALVEPQLSLSEIENGECSRGAAGLAMPPPVMMPQSASDDFEGDISVQNPVTPGEATIEGVDPMPPIQCSLRLNSLTDEYGEPMETAPEITLEKIPEESILSFLPLTDIMADTIPTGTTGSGTVDTILSTSESIGDGIGRTSLMAVLGNIPPVGLAPPSTTTAEKMLIDGKEVELGAETGPAEISPIGLLLPDLVLMADIFYLPFTCGRRGHLIYEEFDFLRRNAPIVRRAKESNNIDLMAEWNRRAAVFGLYVADVVGLYQRMAACPNRGLVYELYPYVHDLLNVMLMLHTFTQWLATGFYFGGTTGDSCCDDVINNQSSKSGAGNKSGGNIFTIGANQSLSSNKSTPDPGAFSNATVPLMTDNEPWVSSGGLVAELQRLLPLETGFDLFIIRPPYPPSDAVFKVRPAGPGDKQAIYTIAMQTFDNGLDASHRFVTEPDLIGDLLCSGFVKDSLSAAHSFVCLTETLIPGSPIIVGYVLVALDAQKYFDSLSGQRGYISQICPAYDHLLITTSDGGDGGEPENSTTGNDDDIIEATVTGSVNGDDEPVDVDDVVDPTVLILPPPPPVPSVMMTSSSDDGMVLSEATDSLSEGPKQIANELHRWVTHPEKTQIPGSVVARYPSYLQLRVLPQYYDGPACKRLTVSALSALKANGSTGVFAEVRLEDSNFKEMYQRLGFFEVTMVENQSPNLMYMGRIL